jgi:type II secretion system protein G
MVIIGLLAGLVAPRYFEQIGKSNTNVAKAQVDSLSKALDAYRLDVGAYPTTEERLDALVTRPQNAPRWNGPYLQKRAAGSMGSALSVQVAGEHGDYDPCRLARTDSLEGRERTQTLLRGESVKGRPAGLTWRTTVTYMLCVFDSGGRVKTIYLDGESAANVVTQA